MSHSRAQPATLLRPRATIVLLINVAVGVTGGVLSIHATAHSQHQVYGHAEA